jgi:hypothetical protein
VPDTIDRRRGAVPRPSRTRLYVMTKLNLYLRCALMGDTG